MKRKITVLATLVIMIASTTTLFSQSIGNVIIDDSTYENRMHEWTWDDDDNYCVRQCMIEFFEECYYINGREDQC